MTLQTCRLLAKRHAARILALIAIAATGLLVLSLVWEIEIFAGAAALSTGRAITELKEALLIGALSAALLILVIRLALSQRREMGRRLQAEREARALAYEDPLTGLANRRQFDEALGTLCATPPAADATHALLLLDLNGFKQVNDVQGHGVGDQVLVAVAGRLRKAARPSDLVARLGGDEFAVLAHHLPGAEGATNLARRILRAFEEPVTVADRSNAIGAGIGIALLPADAGAPLEALRKADVALYKAKAERRSALRFFEEEMDRQLHGRAALERALREAVAAGVIEARFTPSVELHSQRIRGFEVVPHWPVTGEGIAPGRFMPVAEETGLVHAIQASLFEQACAAAARWPAGTTLSFGLQPGQLKAQRLASDLLDTLGRHGIDASRLELEIPESTLVQDLGAVQQALQPLRERGVRVVLGQFGTGYSSLFHLRNFRVDRIKIDRSFTAAMTRDPQSGAIIEALLGLGRGFGIETSADGVENEAQLRSLRESGCERGQGARYGEAQSAEECLRLLAAVAPATVGCAA